MASSTANTILNYKATAEGAYAKLIDINNYPDLGGSPSKLDTTTLSAVKFKTSILGLQEIPDLTFECNYDETALTLIEGMAGDKVWFQLQFGDAGADGSFTWEGQVVAYPMGAGVDEVRKMNVVCSAETEIVHA